MKNIFKSLEKNFILKTFQKRKLFKGLVDVEIEKKSPDWAKESCLVRYILLFKNRKRKIIRGTAKKEFSRKNVWQIMKNIHFSGFNKGGLMSPAPLGYIEEINLLLYEEAPGVPLVEIIETDKKEAENKIIDAAKWLAKFHSLPTKNFEKAAFLGKGGYFKIFQKIKKQIPAFSKVLPPLSCLEIIEKNWKKEKQAVIHNDFYPGNAIVSKSAFYGIDFDKTGTGPFLMDLATMSGALEFPKQVWSSGLTKKQSLNIKNIFLNTYCDLKNIDFSVLEARFRIFTAKIFLDQVHYYSSFTFKGWNFINKAAKQGLILKIKLLLKKTKQFL